MPGKLGDKIRLLHIIDAADELKSYVEGAGFEDFQEQSMMKNACIRQLEIIGEACNRLSEELRNENPQVAWRSIVRLRNILIHQYFGVDAKVVWDIIQNDLPQLENQARLLIKRLDS